MLRFVSVRRITERLPPRFLTIAGYVLDGLLLASFWLVMSIWLNIRKPIAMETEDYFRISIEVGVLLALLALLQVFKLRVRWWAFAIFGVFAVLVRIFLTADNVSNRYLYHDFRVPIDLYLVPEFFRLLYDTSGARQLASYAALFTGFILFSLALTSFGTWACYRALARPRARWLLGAGLGGLGLLGVTSALGGPRMYTQATALRVKKEVVAYSRLDKERRNLRRQIRDVATRIGNGDRLDKLQGHNVLFFFIESYGRTVWERPEHRELLSSHYEAMEKHLTDDGFHVVSNFLTSPTFGGFSWFAHETLNTGFKVTSHLHSRLLEEENPTSLANYFRDAGYRAVTVAPATTRPWPGMEERFGFSGHYFSWHMQYRGPRFAWAPMPDQYIVDFIHRKEVAKSVQPLFVQYVLISTHAPWSDIPRYVDDWSKIRDGSIFNKTPRDNFDVSWSNLDDAAEAYCTSIAYDLKVLDNYLTQFIDDDSLIILVGDHQPNQAITGPENLTWSVPIHVISRNREFVEPFVRRGYTPGMVPKQPMPHAGMERFLEEFLSDFSSEPLTVDPGIWNPPS